MMCETFNERGHVLSSIY